MMIYRQALKVVFSVKIVSVGKDLNPYNRRSFSLHHSLCLMQTNVFSYWNGSVTV